jgi:pilus assembly protein CpaF
VKQNHPAFPIDIEKHSRDAVLGQTGPHLIDTISHRPANRHPDRPTGLNCLDVLPNPLPVHLAQPNLVRFGARQAQIGLPAVAVRDLLKAALRHRPDRIILGEIRGGEAFDLLQLLNTGHSGTLSTIHANSARQGLARFTSCVLQSGVDLPYRAIKTNIADSLNVVVQLERRPGRRYVSEVLEIEGYDPDADLFDCSAIFLAKTDQG